MTNRDRDFAAKFLRELADRLDAAPKRFAESAKELTTGDGADSTLTAFARATYQAAGLEHICRDEATALRYLITEYLMPRQPKARGKR